MRVFFLISVCLMNKIYAMQKFLQKKKNNIMFAGVLLNT